MSVIGSNVLAGASGQAVGAAGYEITRSLRFNSGDTPYLDRTPSSTGNRKTWTWSGWVKFANVDKNDQTLFSAVSGNSYASFRFLGSDSTTSRSYKLNYQMYDGSTNTDVYTQRVLRDPGAFYHIVLSIDFTQSAANDRVKIYVNNELTTNVSISGGSPTIASQNTDTFANLSGAVNNIGRHSIYDEYFDGYLADVHFIDGQALAATDFGEYDDNNVWQPKEFAGTYGTNGFHLDFSDNTSTTTIAEDSSGNNNDWTANNLSVASGAGNDSLIDTPTNYDDGTNVGGNYCTLNPLKNQSQTLKNGNLESNGTSGRSTGTLYASSGKFYWEFTAGTDYTMAGIESSTSPQAASYPGENDQQYALYGNAGSGLLFHNGSTTSVDGFVSGDVIGVALDMDGGNLYFYKNGTAMNSGSAVATGLTGAWTANCRSGSGGFNGDTIFNFGQRPFAHTPPTGHLALVTTNLTDPTIADGSTAFDVNAYSGNGSSQSISLSFEPSLIWTKGRNNTEWHALVDQLRPTSRFLYSNATNAESANQSQGVTAFSSTGYTVGSSDYLNKNTFTYVGWAWNAGTSTVSNTDGSITTSVRANASAGFSIVKGNFSSVGDGTLGHGLNAAPTFYIIRNIDSSSGWYVYTTAVDGTLDFAFLNTTAAFSASARTLPTSSVIQYQSIATGDHIAYCWSPVEGYSAFGSYTGNGSNDGAFVYTGFAVRYLLTKPSSSTGDWLIWDTERDPINPNDKTLGADNTSGENSNGYDVDLLSNGFKWRQYGASANGSNVTYIYAAFAEHPFSLNGGLAR